MNRSTLLVAVSIFVGLIVVAASPASAAGSLATAQAGASGVEWQPAVSGVGLSLTVSGPQGFYLQQRFAPGESPSFSVFDASGNLRPAGSYAYELRPVFQLDEATRDGLQALRDAGDEGGVQKALVKAGKLPALPEVQSGYFAIADGAIEMGGKQEPPPSGARLAAKGAGLAPKTTFTDSLCVGFDCPSSPTFSDSTILMMENNTRIKFGDTSNSPFPNEDWEIEANSSSSGGQSYLGFNDCGSSDNDGGCTTDLVFAVEAGARQNALYVESDGDVGIGTSNPVLELHIVRGDSPGVRLEQDSSSGFAAQTWDVVGNETNYFVRDVTNGSTLPFRIRPGASSNSLFIDSDDDVGIGTASPSSALHVNRTTGALATLMKLTNNSGVQFLLERTDGNDWQISNFNATFQISVPGSATPQMSLAAATGNMTIGGTLTTNGPTCSGGCDLVLSPGYDVEPIETHAAEMFENSYLPAVGPTRPGAPMNLSEKTGGILNELEKAHIYIAQLSRRLEEKQAELQGLRESDRRLREGQQELAEQVKALRELVLSLQGTARE